MQVTMRYCVGPHQSGIRLDHFLMQHITRRSRVKIQKAIQEGRISIHRSFKAPLGAMKPSMHLLPTDEVTLITHFLEEPFVVDSWDVLFEDSSLYVINKPAPLPVHPAGKYHAHTLSELLKLKFPQNPHYLVHRIDRETSGVLVLTKTLQAARHLTTQFSSRLVKKKYIARVHGYAPDTMHATWSIRRARAGFISIKMEIGDEHDPHAETFFTCLEQGPTSLIECRPVTGRQHQIRVHLEALGHPILHDKIYGITEAQADAYLTGATTSTTRHLLHASSLELNHPLSEKPMEFHAPLPEDFKSEPTDLVTNS